MFSPKSTIVWVPLAAQAPVNVLDFSSGALRAIHPQKNNEG